MPTKASGNNSASDGTGSVKRNWQRFDEKADLFGAATSPGPGDWELQMAMGDNLNFPQFLDDLSYPSHGKP